MLLPSPDDDYTPYSNIDSGLSNSTTEGLIEIDAGASGFRYKKQVLARLPFSTTTITDDWWVEATDGVGGAVLFRQRVFFKIFIQAIDGPIPIFIARPADDIPIETTIIDGQDVPPGQAGNYLDLGYKSESAAMFVSDFVANPGSIDGGEVSGEWHSPAYKCDVPEGAIFKILHDGFRPINLSRIATYQTSYRPGNAVDDCAIAPDLGKTFFFYKSDSKLLVASTRRTAPLPLPSSGPIVATVAPKYLSAFRVGGALWCVLGHGTSVGLCISHDDGGNWSDEMPLAPNSQLLACCTSSYGSTVYAIAKATATEVDSSKPESEQVNQGDIVRIVARYSGGATPTFALVRRERIESPPFPEKGLTRLFEHDGRFFLVGKAGSGASSAMRMWQSDNELRTWLELNS